MKAKLFVFACVCVGLFVLVLADNDHVHCESSTYCYDLYNIPPSHQPYRITCNIHNPGGMDCVSRATPESITCSLFTNNPRTLYAEQTIVCSGDPSINGGGNPHNTGPGSDGPSGECDECGRGACPAYCPGPAF